MPSSLLQAPSMIISYQCKNGRSLVMRPGRTMVKVGEIWLRFLTIRVHLSRVTGTSRDVARVYSWVMLAVPFKFLSHSDLTLLIVKLSVKWVHLLVWKIKPGWDFSGTQGSLFSYTESCRKSLCSPREKWPLNRVSMGWTESTSPGRMCVSTCIVCQCVLVVSVCLVCMLSCVCECVEWVVLMCACIHLCVLACICVCV